MTTYNALQMLFLNKHFLNILYITHKSYILTSHTTKILIKRLTTHHLNNKNGGGEGRGGGGG